MIHTISQAKLPHIDIALRSRHKPHLDVRSIPDRPGRPKGRKEGRGGRGTFLISNHRKSVDEGSGRLWVRVRGGGGRDGSEGRAEGGSLDWVWLIGVI